MKDLNRILHSAVTRRHHPWCLATLVKAEGSSYRQPGARLLVHPDGCRTIGYLSAGCLEEEIARQGKEVAQSGVPRLVEFDTRRLFGCDGKLSIYLEKIPAAEASGNFLTNMAVRIARRELCRVAVPYARARGSRLLPDKASGAGRTAADEGVFRQILLPSRRLIMFGTGPEVVPLKYFAEGLGWTCQCYAHPDELPDDFQADDATAAVVMTHKTGRDLTALHRLVPLGLPYIGLLGAKRRHQEVVSLFVNLYSASLPHHWLRNLHAPAGLDTGGESPEEIAFSILAEAAAVLSGRSGGFLKDKPGPIHSLEGCV